jgi:5-hydroxyisourate hydrolase-like protein (transthyretin family)
VYPRDPDGPPGTDSTPIGGYTVTLSDGQTTRSTTTARDGTYEFTGVAAGDYTARVQLPDTEDGGGPDKVRLADPRGCAAANFYVVADGRIRVRLVDADGRPAAKLKVDLLNLDAESDERPAWQTVFSETDDAGVLELEQLRPKRYVLAIRGVRLR